MEMFKLCKFCHVLVEDGGDIHDACQDILNKERYIGQFKTPFQNSETGEASSPESFIELSGGSLYEDISQTSFKLKSPVNYNLELSDGSVIELSDDTPTVRNILY